MSFPLTYSAFIAAFAEFAETDQPYVQSKLDAAARQIDVKVWAEIAEDGHGQLTGHMLAMSALGNAGKLVTTSTTTYGVEYLRLLRMRTAGIRST